MVAGDGDVEGADLLVKAFGEASVGVADSDTDLTHHRSPSVRTADGGLAAPARVAGARVQGCLTRTARV
jgi:hypothetical protein